MDSRLQQLSYSSLLTLHSCPRLFQLQKLQAERPEVDFDSSVTFAFGHLVGDGIQQALQGYSMQAIYFSQFAKWEPELFAENIKQVKSFWHAMFAVEKFVYMREHGFLDGWELMHYNGVPAVELSFRITFPDGFKYRGFVDAVLQHSETGKVMVLECKTTSATSLNPATYKNSAQAVGYSIVLDSLVPDLSSYEVLYLAYKTKSMEYEQLPFEKSYLQRALWIRELLLDIESIKMYDAAGVFPMHGESCYSFYRECAYLGLCTLSTENLTDPPPITEKVEEFQIELTLQDLIDSQLGKTL
jgi:hypothetical protein